MSLFDFAKGARQLVDCPECEGSGQDDPVFHPESKCARCEGRGKIWARRARLDCCYEWVEDKCMHTTINQKTRRLWPKYDGEDGRPHSNRICFGNRCDCGDCVHCGGSLLGH